MLRHLKACPQTCMRLLYLYTGITLVGPGLHHQSLFSPPYEVSVVQEVAPEQKQVSQGFALLCLETSPPDVLVILKELLRLSDKDCNPEQGFSGNVLQPKNILEGLFSGKGLTYARCRTYKYFLLVRKSIGISMTIQTACLCSGHHSTPTVGAWCLMHL